MEYESLQSNTHSGGESKRRKVIAGSAGILLVTFVICAFLFFSSQGPVQNEEEEVQESSVECPGSPSAKHAHCALMWHVKGQTCDKVVEEALARIKGEKAWTDPKSKPGKYELLKESSTQVFAQRTTGDGTNYVDKFLLTFVDNSKGKHQGCVVQGCSDAVSPSYEDYSSNYCNMFNVLCGSNDDCTFVHHDLKINRENLVDCEFHKKSECKR